MSLVLVVIVMTDEKGFMIPETIIPSNTFFGMYFNFKQFICMEIISAGSYKRQTSSLISERYLLNFLPFFLHKSQVIVFNTILINMIWVAMLLEKCISSIDVISLVYV